MKRLLLCVALLCLLAVPCAATLPTTVVTLTVTQPDGSKPVSVGTAWAKVTQLDANDPMVLNKVWRGAYSATAGTVTWTLPKNSEVQFYIPDYMVDGTYALDAAATYSLNGLVPITASTAPGWAGPLAPLLTVPAKGSMFGSTGTIFGFLAAGTNGQVVTADSTQTYGFKWATPAAEADTLDTVTSRGATTTNAVTVGNCTSGAAGADGKLVLYSEQGATDYSVSLNPHATMTSAADFYLPADEPTAESFVKMGTDGVLDYDTSTYLTAEVDAVIGNEVTDVANTTLLRSGSGTGAAPYKLAVNPAYNFAWTGVHSFVNDNGVAIHDPGFLDIYSAGSTHTWFIPGGINRLSAGAETYNIQNSGAGAMTLQVDANTVWHAGNDGSGSGLDADTLDTLSSAAFALAAAWVPTPANPGDDGKYLKAGTGAFSWQAAPAEVDGIIGNEVTDAANTTLTRSGAGTGADPYKLALNLSSANTWTAAQLVDPGAQAASAPPGDALGCINDEPSTVGATVQESPAVRWESHAWDSNASAPDQDDAFNWRAYVVPASAATTTSIFKLGVSKKAGTAAAGAETFPLTLQNNGTLTISNDIISTSGGIQKGTFGGAHSLLLGYGYVAGAYGSYLSWEGATGGADASEGQFTFADPTADRTITVPDEGGVMQLNGTANLTADDVTPTMVGARIWLSVANSGATVITDLDNPVVGQIYILIVGSATNPISIADSGNFALSAAWAPDSVGDNLALFVAADNTYYEISRSNN